MIFRAEVGTGRPWAGVRERRAPRCVRRPDTSGFRGAPGAGLGVPARSRLFPWIAGAVLAFAAGVPALAATFTVNSTTDAVDSNIGNGVCATAGGVCSLRAAIQEANALAGSHTINVPAGAYLFTRVGSGEDSAATGDLDILKATTIVGAGARATIIDANALDRCFDVSFGFSLILSGVTVQNGNVGTSWGGGIYVWGSTLTLTDVTIRASTAGIGGGLDLEGGAQASLTRVTLSGNTATTNDGGGINVAASTANLVNVTLSGNAATKAGVSEGGAIYLDGGGSSVSLTNCTIAGNSAIIGGGGIRRNGGTITLKNTIVANNTSGNCSGTITSGGNNLDSANTCAFAGAGDKINSNPLLGALQDNGGPTDTLALATGSPAIDAGTATGAPATDQRGVLRPQGAAYDIGAFERAGYSIAGRVFEDANFAGTASGWDGGASDLGLANVDVELYNAGTNAYITSTTTAAGGTFSFSIVANGSYKVRVRSATIGDADTVPKGGLNGTVPATWPYPLAEMTWGNGAALYGGQSATVDDTATGDNAGPGDTFVPVTVSGADVTGVDLGFAYNLIVNAGSDANADATRSKQGTLRQFIKNGNATGSAGGTTANASQFRIPATDPNYNAGTGVFTISPTTVLPLISDPLVLDGQTQPGWTSAPIVELAGPGGSYEGLRVSGGSSTLRGLAIDRFTVGILLMTNGNNVIEACSIGTNAAGNAAAPNTTYGVWVNNTAGNRIGGTTPGSGNVISGNASQGIYLFNAGATGNLVQGNFIGTNAAEAPPSRTATASASAPRSTTPSGDDLQRPKRDLRKLERRRYLDGGGGRAGT